MVRLMSVKAELTAENGVTKIVGTVLADIKTDITPGLEINGDVLDFGSVAITTSGEIAICGSDGSWNWLEA